MDFSDILSYPSPNDSTRAHIQSTDLHTCQRYLNVCASLINTLSDTEIDIRSVHYKYRIERFLRSRSRTTQRFLNTYEQRFPYLAIPKDQVFIYESDGNVRIDLSTPTTSKKPPLRKEKLLLLSSKQQRIEEKQVSRQHEAAVMEEFHKSHKKIKKPRQPKILSCWTVAIYHPIKVEPTICECDITAPPVIPLYWKTPKEKSEPIICDLRDLFYYDESFGPIECDLRPLFFFVSKDVECDYYIAPLFCETISELSPLGSNRVDERIETPSVDLLLSIFDYLCAKRAIVIVFAIIGMLLFLICYACLGVRIFHQKVFSVRFPMT